MTGHRKSGYSADPVEGQGLLDLGALAATTPDGDTPKTTAGRRRLARQLQALRHGQHPLALNPMAVPTGRLKLHPDAADPTDRTAPGLRCGTCQLRQPQTGGSRDYPKCAWPDPIHVSWPRATHGDGSDVRAWWPACVDYQPRPDRPARTPAAPPDVAGDSDPWTAPPRPAPTPDRVPEQPS